MNLTELDRSTWSVGLLHDEPGDLAYWLAQKPEDRLAGIEFLRQQFFDYAEARSQLRRFFEVVELPRS